MKATEFLCDDLREMASFDCLSEGWDEVCHQAADLLEGLALDLDNARKSIKSLKALVNATQELLDIYETECERSDCTDHDLPQSILEAEQNIANLRSGLDL